ncbi:MAG: lipoprotein [Faecousia sp.]
MKRTICLILATLFLLSLAACGTGEPRQSAPPTTDPAVTDPVTQPTEPEGEAPIAAVPRGDLSDHQSFSLYLSESQLAVFDDLPDYLEPMDGGETIYPYEYQRYYGFCKVDGTLLTKPAYRDIGVQELTDGFLWEIYHEDHCFGLAASDGSFVTDMIYCAYFNSGDYLECWIGKPDDDMNIENASFDLYTAAGLAFGEKDLVFSGKQYRPLGWDMENDRILCFREDAFGEEFTEDCFAYPVADDRGGDQWIVLDGSLNVIFQAARLDYLGDGYYLGCDAGQWTGSRDSEKTLYDRDGNALMKGYFDFYLGDFYLWGDIFCEEAENGYTVYFRDGTVLLENVLGVSSMEYPRQITFLTEYGDRICNPGTGELEN